MEACELLGRWLASEDYRGQAVHSERIPARPPSYATLERPLPPGIQTSLEAQGIRQLYTHQCAAVEAARQGRDFVVVTSTASGKTLCYNLPVAETLLADPRGRALYLFPTKSLAQDQLIKLSAFDLAPPLRQATFDGDTPSLDRRAIRKASRVVLTNPDMLHVGILPNHASWSQFLARLRFIVVDEIHVYRGVFGAHVASVLRRLLRLAESYGASPQMIACSATIANPGELMRRLTGREADLIACDGSPSGPRTFVLWEPPPTGDGTRASANSEATRLFCDLVSHGVRTLAFARSRKGAELILKYAREGFARTGSSDGERITSYRAGYTPEHRRQIEQALFRGDLLGVTATNALELGVDLGNLDATLSVGYPGSVSSAWQQAGRAGRSGRASLSVLIGLDDPLDRFVLRHPEFLFGGRCEQAVLDPGNRRVLQAHLACAAHERPLSGDDLARFGPNATAAVQGLEEEGRLDYRNGRFFYGKDDYPAMRVNIRSASAESYEIRLHSTAGELLGTMDSARVPYSAHPGAIYLHMGEALLVTGADEARRVIVVEPADADYYTEPRSIGSVTVLEDLAVRPEGLGEVHFGSLVVTSQVIGYRRKQLHSDRVLEACDLVMPESTFETEGFWILFPASLGIRLAERGLDLAGGIHSLEHALTGMLPMIALCDRMDVLGASVPFHPDTGAATLFLYDAHPGGVGLSEVAFERLQELLLAARETIASCRCDDGCPACIQSPYCGLGNDPLDKAASVIAADFLLKRGAE